MTDFLTSFYESLVGVVEEDDQDEGPEPAIVEEEDPSYVEEVKDERSVGLTNPSRVGGSQKEGFGDVAETEPMVVMEVYTKGALVRSGVALDSPAIGVTLNRGDAFRCGGRRDLGHVAPCGTRRVVWRDERTGRSGFVSRKCLRDKRWRERARQTARARWRVDVDAWRPPLKDGGAEWTFLLALISEPEERTKVLQFVHWIDRARALASRLLVRRCCELCLGLDHAAVEVERTKGRKPYLSARAKGAAPRRLACPNFNFNVSHDGRYVVLASEAVAVCGVDVAAPDRTRNDMRPRGKCRRPDASVTDLTTMPEEDLSHMRDSLTQREWDWVQAGAPSDRGLRFRRLWSGKEAFTKARGDGLGFNFARIHLDVEQIDDPLGSGRRRFESRVAVDGQAKADWRVHGEVLDLDHVVSVARGPVSDVQDAQGTFVSTLTEKVVDASHLDADADDDFVSLDVADLVPESKLAAYHAALREDKNAYSINKRKQQSMRPYKSTGDMRQLSRIAEEKLPAGDDKDHPRGASDPTGASKSTGALRRNGSLGMRTAST